MKIRLIIAAVLVAIGLSACQPPEPPPERLFISTLDHELVVSDPDFRKAFYCASESSLPAPKLYTRTEVTDGKGLWVYVAPNVPPIAVAFDRVQVCPLVES